MPLARRGCTIEHDQSKAADEPPRVSFGARLRNYFLTGLIVVGPVTVTIYIVYWFVNWVDGWVKPLMPSFSRFFPDWPAWQSWFEKVIPRGWVPDFPGMQVPGVGLIFAIFGLTLIGALAANLFGRTLVSYTEGFVSRMPIVRSVYKPVKQIFETVLSQGNSSFRRAGLIEFPRRGSYAIAFVSSEANGEIADKLPGGHDMLTVFLPATPPTSGYLMFMPRSEVIILDMSVEDAAKLVLSAGLVTPEYQNKLQNLAIEAKAKAV